MRLSLVSESIYHSVQVWTRQVTKSSVVLKKHLKISFEEETLIVNEAAVVNYAAKVHPLSSRHRGQEEVRPAGNDDTIQC